MAARLPLDPNLGFYRKRAKELKRALAARDESAARRFVKSHPKFARRSPAQAFEADVSLGDAQLVVARELGSSTWNEFKAAVEAARGADAPSDADRAMRAIGAGDAASLRELLAKTPSLATTADARGRLPLVEACDRGDLALVDVLLDAGADPRRGDPLMAAIHAGPHKRGPALDVVARLIERGAPDDVFTHAALGRVDELRRELPRVAIDARGPSDATALYLAAWNGHAEAVRVLLAAGADTTVTSGGLSVWQRVFQHIWSERHRDVARALLEHGVACTLVEACVLSHLPTVRGILARDPAALEQSDRAGRTPLELAVLNADVPLARTLLEAGAEDPRGRGRALVDAVPVQGQRLARGVYRSSTFELTNFHDCNFGDVTFSNVNLAGARFDNVNLGGARIDNAHLSKLTIFGIEVAPLLQKELERRAAKGRQP